MIEKEIFCFPLLTDTSKNEGISCVELVVMGYPFSINRFPLNETSH